MYGNYVLTVTDSDGVTTEEKHFESVLIDYSRRGVAVLSKTGLLLYFISANRNLTVRVELEQKASGITRNH